MKFDEPLTHDAVEIELGEPVAFGDHDPELVLRTAAAGSPPGSEEGLDRALVAEAARRGALPTSTFVGYVAARGDNSFSLTEVRDGDDAKVTIARGDPRTIVEQVVHPSRARQARAIASKAELSSRAWRPLAVATRAEGEDGWELLGYIPVRVWSRQGHKRGRSFDYHLVWDMWLRMCHWSWVAAIIVLTITGYVIANPGWIPTWEAERPGTGFFMGYVRYVHLLAAVLLMAVLIIRVWNLSTSRIPYDRWSALVPFRNKRQAGNGVRTLEAYLFIRPGKAPEYFGHNPLQQLAYTTIYLIFLLQVITGLALWGLYDTQGWFWGLFQGLNHLMGTQQVRLLHYVVMWVIILFVPLHMYLSVRADSVDRSGAISSMVSGGRWVRRGAEFEDWPPQQPGTPDPVGLQVQRDFAAASPDQAADVPVDSAKDAQVTT